MEFYGILWFLSLLVIGGSKLTGVLYVLDNTFSLQEIHINESLVTSNHVTYDPSVPINIPLPILSAQSKDTRYISLDDTTLLLVSGSNLVVINITTSFTYNVIPLPCTPVYIEKNGDIVLCPVSNNQLSLLEKVSNFNSITTVPLPHIATINGILMRAPNNGIIYITGVNGNIFIWNFNTNEKDLTGTPCNYISDIKIISGGYFTLFCADNSETSTSITSVHFRNLIESRYTSVRFANGALDLDDLFLTSYNSVVVIANNTFLIVINRTNGVNVVHDVASRINDVIVLNESVAYYQTSQLNRFSPSNLLNREMPRTNSYKPSTCGPPDCPYLMNINDMFLLFTLSNSSQFALKDAVRPVVSGTLSVSPYLYIPDLTFIEQSTSNTVTPTTSDTRKTVDSTSMNIQETPNINKYQPSISIVLSAVFVPLFIVALLVVVVLGICYAHYKRVKLPSPIQEMHISVPEQQHPTQETSSTGDEASLERISQSSQSSL